MVDTYQKAANYGFTCPSRHQANHPRKCFEKRFSTGRTQVSIKEVAPRDGFEPPARRLTVVCSTAELPGINA